MDTSDNIGIAILTGIAEQLNPASCSLEQPPCQFTIPSVYPGPTLFVTDGDHIYKLRVIDGKVIGTYEYWQPVRERYYALSKISHHNYDLADPNVLEILVEDINALLAGDS